MGYIFLPGVMLNRTRGPGLYTTYLLTGQDLE